MNAGLVGAEEFGRQHVLPASLLFLPRLERTASIKTRRIVLGRNRAFIPDFRVPDHQVRVFCHKAGDQLGDFVTVLFQGKMSGIEEMKLNVIQIAPVRVCAVFGEDVVVFAHTISVGG